MFYDAAGNMMMPPSSPSRLCIVRVDTSSPNSPIVNPQYITTDTSFTLSINGEVGTSLFINDVFYSEIPGSGSVDYLTV